MRVLILEDSEDDSLLILRELKQGGFEPDHLRVETREGMADALDAGGWDVIIADYVMPRFNALEALRLMQNKGIDLPFIIVSGSIGEETAVEAMQAGARDYLMKGNLARLAAAVARELEQVRLRRAHLRAEEELRAREHQLSYIYSNVSEVIYYLSVEEDGRFRFLSVNQAFLDATGLVENQVVGKYVDEVIPEPSLGLVLAKYRQAIRDDETVKWEEVADYPAGTKYGEVAVTPVYDANGVCAGLVGIVHDFSERKRAEEALRRERDMAQRYLDVAGVILLVLDTEAGVVLVNKQGCEILGYEEEEIVGRNWIETFLPERVREEVGRVVTAILKGDVELNEYDENLVLRKDGEERVIAWHHTILRSEKGDLLGSISSGEDITERKRTMERLEKLNRCFLSLGSDPRENVVKILATGRDILGAVSLEYCCRARSLQYHCSDSGTRSEPLAKEKGCCYVPDDGLAAGQAFVPDIERIPPEERRPDVDGQSLRSLLAVPIKIGEELVGSLCLFDTARRDFTIEERELLMMLARAIGIEEDRFRHEESLRDFLDIASHELRHPITIMKGYSLILKEQGDLIDESNRDIILSIIDHGADRLDNLVGGLLDVSRIERGRFEVKRSRQPIVPLIERSIEEMGARGFNNEFISHLPGALKPCRVDEDKFAQLIVILLDNAVKYSPSGSTIEVEAVEADEGVLVSVLDRGLGIPDENRERIFDRFFQVEEVTHHSTPGMGMGLYIARNIAEAHGGRIWYEPREGGGSAFRFNIPR